MNFTFEPFSTIISVNILYIYIFSIHMYATLNVNIQENQGAPPPP